MKHVPFSFILLQLVYAGTSPKLPVTTGVSRIVNGVKVNHEENPSMVALFRNGGHICGASIVNRQYVLTAAHCCPIGIPAKNYKIITGALHIGDNQVVHSHSTEYRISRIDIHEKYESVEHAYDIALLRTKTPIKLIPHYVQRAILPSSGEDHCDNATVWGWGQLSAENENASDDLLKVTVPLVDFRKCALNYKKHKQRYTIYKALQLCYGSEGKDSCIGDSGGPLTCTGSPYYQIGIVSFGIGCAEAKYPGVYTRVAMYRDWIDTKVTQVYNADDTENTYPRRGSTNSDANNLTVCAITILCLHFMH